jgi:hypothetical protein
MTQFSVHLQHVFLGVTGEQFGISGNEMQVRESLRQLGKAIDVANSGTIPL